MSEKGTRISATTASSSGGTEKLNEGDVLNLVLDYLATKGFVEAEQTLRQSLSASGNSIEPGRHSTNQGSGEEM